MLFALALSAEAQQPQKVPRIGYLAVASLSSSTDRIEPFRQGLRELGYVEGKNLIIEWRSADGKSDRMPTLAAELVQLKVDVIVTPGTGATRPAREATSTIPIVMAQDDDPVANGFVASLARPGGNITGLSTLSPEIGGKRLELLKEIVPKLARVAVFGTSTSAAAAKALEEIKLAAGAMKVQLQYLDVLNSKDTESAFRAAAKGRADAVLWLVNPRPPTNIEYPEIKVRLQNQWSIVIIPAPWKISHSSTGGIQYPHRKGRSRPSPTKRETNRASWIPARASYRQLGRNDSQKFAKNFGNTTKESPTATLVPVFERLVRTSNVIEFSRSFLKRAI